MFVRESGYQYSDYEFRFPEFFESKIQKLYITHVLIPNNALQEEAALLRNFLERHGYHFYRWTFSRGPRLDPNWPRDRRKILKQIHRKEIQEAEIAHYLGELSHPLTTEVQDA